MTWTLYRQHRGVVAAAHAGVRSVDAGTVLRWDERAVEGATRRTIVMPALLVMLPVLRALPWC
ncbi:hypothetical protein ACQP60_02910 [Isoptericola variabilis]|uniref:hypothetical protein n=1 Tax=Isoptericola variabilis TaxID=139208 RepID=UPI003D1B233C